MQNRKFKAENDDFSDSQDSIKDLINQENQEIDEEMVDEY